MIFKKLNNFFTPEEEKIILFLVIFAFLGMILNYSGLIAFDRQDQEMDSLKFLIKEDVQLQFDLLTVTQKELIKIPGIGSKRASDILSYRDDFGFLNLDELINVKGIGKATLLKIRKYFVEFGHPVEKAKILKKEFNDKVETPVIGKININNASIKELILLKGIGESKAKKIIEYRNANGDFKNIDQLLNVKGIGKKTLEKNRKQISLED